MIEDINVEVVLDSNIQALDHQLCHRHGPGHLIISLMWLVASGKFLRNLNFG